VPDLNKQEIEAFQELIREKNPQIYWEAKEKFHITTNFIGSIGDAEIHQLSENLRAALASFPSFQIQPNHVSYFYKKHGDSIVFLGVENKELKALEKIIREVVSEFGFSPPIRYQPHLTIGRLKRLRHPNQVKQVLSGLLEHETPDFSPFAVNSVVIYQSGHWKDDSPLGYKLKSEIAFEKGDSQEVE
jgi:2'-5' RNA ligase